MSSFYSISSYIGFFFELLMDTPIFHPSLSLSFSPRGFNGLISVGWVGSNAIALCDLPTNKYIHKHSVTHCFYLQQPYLSISVSRDWPDTDGTSQQLIDKSKEQAKSKYTSSMSSTLCTIETHLINKEWLKMDSCIKWPFQPIIVQFIVHCSSHSDN